MTTGGEEVGHQVPQDGEKRLNPFQRIAGVIVSPVETFREIAARPDWLVILILTTLISVVTSMVVVPHLDLETSMRERFAEQNLPEEKADQAIEGVKKFQKFGAASAVVMTPVMLALLAGIFLLGFKLMGAEGTFRQMFSATNYAWIPQVIKGILLAVILSQQGMLSPEEMGVALKSNLGFLADPKESAVLFSLLSSVDIFNIWTLALLIIGYRWAGKVTTGRSAAVVLTIYGVYLVGKIAFAALQGAAT